MRVMYLTLKRQKSISSHAASISAWCAVFDWPSIVAALSVCRHGPASSSAARRKTAARSSQGVRDQSCHASADAAVVRLHGLEGVARANLLAAEHERDVELLGLHLLETQAQLLALGVSRRVAPDRLVVRLGNMEDRMGAHASIVGGIGGTKL